MRRLSYAAAALLAAGLAAGCSGSSSSSANKTTVTTPKPVKDADMGGTTPLNKLDPPPP